MFAAGLLAAAALGLASICPFPLKLVCNLSASAPTGFYWIADRSFARGDLVLAWLPATAASLAADRGYLPLGIPVLKQISALAGDEICRFGGSLFINGQFAAKALARDRRGREMPVWTGCHRLGAQEVFLLNAHPQSFDGRYFGAIAQDRVVGKAMLLF
ncbi:S26 family signal peptidase [Govanella unica]|uniref:S26 family signal peptidase n=1 Tax=Govanella unica TaxID=2975056 RepID=A0A9X3TXV9_9PROT|nr:S26 family signal peptidase [Govania unica]MDA5193692.1 S26 family signal peptidase [Govania unica]